MKNLFKCSSLIKVVVIIVVMAFMASQVTNTYAGKKGCKQGYHNFNKRGKCERCKKMVTDTYAGYKCKNGNHRFNKRGKCKRCKKIIKIIINKHHECPECPDTTPDCNICPPPAGITKSWVEKTGQTPAIPLNPAPTGSDGDLEKGVAWPNPRFTDNGDGTVTDNLTCLIWTKEANCFEFRNWSTALSDCNSLASGSCGLTDGSGAGDWRLPNVRELNSLIHYGVSDPAISGPFSNVQSFFYWSSTTGQVDPDEAWAVGFLQGLNFLQNKTVTLPHAWCLRGGT